MQKIDVRDPAFVAILAYAVALPSQHEVVNLLAPTIGDDWRALFVSGFKSTDNRYGNRLRWYPSNIDSGNQHLDGVPVTGFVAGGAGPGGGGASGGGGGAGGRRAFSALLVLGQNYAVTIGAGGVGENDAKGTAGNSSTFDSTVASGGAPGGANNIQPGSNGASGGGGRGFGTNAGGTGNTPSTSPAQGYNGGIGSAGANNYKGGGGGGADGPGINGDVATVGGDGGPGVSTNISGTPTRHCRGGEGGEFATGTRNGVDGAANTGNGGEGGYQNPGGAAVRGGHGGSGTIWMEYPAQFTIHFGAGVTGTETNRGDGYKYAMITAGTGNIYFTA